MVNRAPAGGLGASACTAAADLDAEATAAVGLTGSFFPPVGAAPFFAHDAVPKRTASAVEATNQDVRIMGDVSAGAVSVCTAARILPPRPPNFATHCPASA